MRRLFREKKGQFIIIAALLIAALTLATTISIYEINIQRQSITYRPVDEFLLGTTSDMNRVLAASLANYTDGIINQNLTEAETSIAASQSITTWKESMLTSYSSYGIRMKEPLLPTWNCLWNGTTTYSLAAVIYDIDVDSYGFKGWMGRSYRYVQLQIFPGSIQSDSATTSFNFTLKESAINQDATIPISGLPQSPDPQFFRVGNYTPSQPFDDPATEVSLQYYGNGNYNVTFNQPVDPTTLGVRLDLATPTDKVWISANNFNHVNDWSTLHFVSGAEKLQPNYLYTPGSSSFYTPPLNQGNPSITLSSPETTQNISTARFINITVYLSSTPPKAAKTLNFELGFTYNDTYYQIGTAETAISGKCIRDYSVSIDAGEIPFVDEFGVRTIPEGSYIQLCLTMEFDGPCGCGKIYLDGDTPSQIDLY
jgi:hypothetical protein